VQYSKHLTLQLAGQLDWLRCWNYLLYIECTVYTRTMQLTE